MNEIAIVPTPEAQEAIEAINVTENRIQAFVLPKLVTPRDYTNAGEELKRVKGIRNRVEAARKAMTAPLDATRAAIMDFFRAPLDRLDDAERKIKQALVAYDREQQEIARRQQEEADRAAERERRFNEQRAARAAERGETDTAADHLAAAAAVQAPVIVREPPKVAQVSFRSEWKCEITDASLLPREYLMPDEPKIRRVVKAMKADAKIPGVRVWEDKIVAAGSR